MRRAPRVDGYLERFPELKICIAHGGGYIPGYWGRFDHAFAHREDCRVTIKKPPSEYLKKLYFDTVVFDERELKHLIEIWAPITSCSAPIIPSTWRNRTRSACSAGSKVSAKRTWRW